MAFLHQEWAEPGDVVVALDLTKTEDTEQG
jgi:hypothetical protein